MNGNFLIRFPVNNDTYFDDKNEKDKFIYVCKVEEIASDLDSPKP